MAITGAFFILFGAVLLISHVNADCAKMTFNMMECCKFPEMKGPEVEKMMDFTKKNLGDKQDKADYMTECQAMEGVFKEYKFAKENDIDDVAIVAFFDKVNSDAEWKAVFKEAIAVCKTKVNAKAAEIAKKMEAAPFNVKGCNTKFPAFIACMKMESFEKCPVSKWTDGKDCGAAKAWFADCGKTIDSVMELHSKKL